MKNLKKVLALVMACAMLFTMSSFAFSDVAEDASYLEAVTMLSKLGIINGYEDGTFLPDNTITRAEAAKVLVCALNAAEQAEGMVEDNIFTDVPGSHWAAGYVNYAANFGIIAGRGNGIFDPEAPVTYEEIVKMVVAMLGYTPVANVKGGYPTGYLYVANNIIKITKGATGITGDAAKRWVVARLLFNALEAKIMEQETWSATDPEYIQGDQTLLKDFLEITKVEGVVTETFYTAGKVDKDNEEVTITITAIDDFRTDAKLVAAGYNYGLGIGDELIVDVNGTGAENYAAYTITAYVREFDEDNELVAIAPKGNKNSTLEIPFDMFEAGSWEAKNTYYVFEYYQDMEDEDPVKAKVSKEVLGEIVDGNQTYKQKDAAYFINSASGKLTSFSNMLDGTGNNYGEKYTGDDGVVRLLDNDGNGVYDFVFVEETSDEIFVESINAKSNKITGKGSKTSVTLDPEDDDYYITFMKDGEVVDFDAIEEGDVLSIVDLYDNAGKNNTVKKVYISSEKVEGRVTSASVANNKYKIAGDFYKASANFKGTAIATKEEGTFYLNYTGKILYREAISNAGGNYAFVLDVNTSKPIFGEPVYTVLMMNEKGEWITAEISNKISFYVWDGSDVARKKLADSDLANMADIEKLIGANWLTTTKNSEGLEVLDLGTDLAKYRVVQYALNSDGELSSITFPRIDKIANKDSVDNDDFIVVDEFTKAEYNETRNRFATIEGKGGVDETTIVFTVDLDKVTGKTMANVDKKKYVSLADASVFEDEEDYTGVVFDCVEKIYKCAIITDSAATIAEEASLLVVDEIVKEINDEDEDYIVITGYMDGEEVTLETVAEDDLTVTGIDGKVDTKFVDDCEKAMYNNGAVLEVALDGAGIVTDVKVVFTKDKAAGYFYNKDANGKAYDYEDEDGLAYYFGLLVDEDLDGNYTLLADEDGKEVVLDTVNGTKFISEINVKDVAAYNVDLTRKAARYSADNAVDGFLGSVYYLDVDDPRGGIDKAEMKKDDDLEVNYAFAKVYDGEVIDMVVYTVKYNDADPFKLVD